MTRELPPIILRLLMNLYVGGTANVLWNGAHSDLIHIKNGVKQGGINLLVLCCFAFI